MQELINKNILNRINRKLYNRTKEIYKHEIYKQKITYLLFDFINKLFLILLFFG